MKMTIPMLTETHSRSRAAWKKFPGSNRPLLKYPRRTLVQPLRSARLLSNMYHRMAPARHDLPSLMIMGYVGHSAVDNASGMIKFIGGNGHQKALWKYIAQCYFSDDETLENLDSLAILDCCYSGAIRENHPRASQVIAACGVNETARSRSAGFVGFSQRFLEACRSLAAREHQPFTTIDAIYHEMCHLRPTGSPELCIWHLGNSGKAISLSFQSRRPTGFPRPLQTSSEYQLLVKLSVEREQDEDSEAVVTKLQNTFERFPSQYKVEIIGAYESTSVLFVLKMSYFAFSRFSSTTTLDVIGPVKGLSLLDNAERRNGI